MKLLSIETSCDDTGITLMQVGGSKQKPTFKVLCDSLSSQTEIHTQYGGVFPMMAKREHIKNLPILLEHTLKTTKLDTKKKPFDAIAVTYGPGLEPCLWTGITFAQELSKKWNVPIIPVNHMEGHILSVFGKNKGSFNMPKVEMPMLSLLVSGGHTQLVLSKKWMEYKIIGESVDDAVGEAFDKVARMMGLPYPGGPHISRLAEQERIMGNTGRADIKLPRPMIHSKDFNFSFSGLKTAVLYLIKKIAPDGKLDDKTKAHIALEFENAAIECLTHKTRKALEKYKIKTLVVSGGVACNKHLHSEMKKMTQEMAKASEKPAQKIALHFPTRELSTDNSLMVGIAGYMRWLTEKTKILKVKNIKAKGNLRLK